ncbi:MAG TPA: hypothetical protein VD963_04860 [Phycisphaerales bacterium]|nr:hypothetical protein [Phycisphaerales bacterium]
MRMTPRARILAPLALLALSVPSHLAPAAPPAPPTPNAAAPQPAPRPAPAPLGRDEPEAARIRLEIGQALRQMEAAVLAANQEAYLAWVVPAESDPVFRTEQVNWAKDLGRHVPAEFTLEIVDPAAPQVGDAGAPGPAAAAPPDQPVPPPPGTPDDPAVPPPVYTANEARFTLRMTWRMPPAPPRDDPAAEPVPKRERRVSFPVRFVRLPLSGRWYYAGEDWASVTGAAYAPDSGPVVVKYLGDSRDIAERVAETLPRVRRRVDEGFEYRPAITQEVKLYPSMRHLQASIYLSYADPLSGWNEPGEAIKILARENMMAGALEPLLAHEYGHVATFELGEHATKMPWWLVEGVAELAAEAFSPGLADASRAAVESWARRGRLAPWEPMADFYTCPPRYHGHVYRQGHHLLGFVSETFGRTKRNQWLTLMARGGTLDEATAGALGLSWAQLDERWRATLPTAEPPQPEPDPEP